MDPTQTSYLSTRALTEHDYSNWFLLWKNYQMFYKAEIADEISRVTYSRLIDPGEPLFGAAAMSGDKTVGIVHWVFHRSTWTLGDYCYLQDLYVDEQHRRYGIGRLLIEHVYLAADRVGCSRVYWLTHESNARAMQLYEKVAQRTGFIHYKRTA